MLQRGYTSHLGLLLTEVSFPITKAPGVLARDLCRLAGLTVR